MNALNSESSPVRDVPLAPQHQPQRQRASPTMAPKKDKYSVILPTYNERQNLPVLVQMLYDVFTKE